jgi:predicted GNAT family N-acyltransferase
MTLTFRPAYWQMDQQALSMIRRKVFIEEQQVDVADEWDDKDETAIHFLVETAKQNAIACARLLIESDLYHIGRVAVLKEYRHQRIGRQLMQFIVDWCRQQNPEYKIYLHAQTSRIQFYKYLGFQACGDVFMDAGIEHIEMWYQSNSVSSSALNQ